MQQKRGQNRRGLSTVIVTLILILVSLVAVGVIWVVVRNIIQTGTEGVGLSQFSLSAKILDVAIDNSSNNISLTVKRNAGEGELEGISFVFSSGENNEVITRNVSLKELEQMKFYFHLINTSVSDLISVSIVPLIKQDEKQITGIALDKYNLGKNQNAQSGQTACTPTNCSILGYVCGTWNNGTCSGTLSCGNCTGGQTCNANGRCVASCIPANCTSLGYQCGSGYANGTCAGTLSCGSCGTGYNCNSTGRCVANRTYVYALSCSYADVSSAVAVANPQDTVVVPACSATWTSMLFLTKGINLIGAGIGNTTITAGIDTLISYAPTTATGIQNYALRISGFSFILNTNKGIGLCGSTKYGSACASSNNMGVVTQTKIRIDHNNFSGSGSSGIAIEVVGAFRGVVDHNIFDNVWSPQRAWGTGDGKADWDTFGPLTYGTADNMYYEDNTFTNCCGYMVSDCDQGGRYVYRYNTISLKQSMYPLLDFHGGRTSGAYSCFSGEVYGNRIITYGYDAGGILSHRGGKALAFFNNAPGLSSGSGDIKVYTNDGCPLADHYNDQLIQESYYFINKRGDTGLLINASIQIDNCGYIVENSNFWHDATPFNGITGVGCGTLTQMNAITICTNGVGFWVTNQSCSNLSNIVGANPTTPISGTLYRCSSNNWIPYYTPYPYPHPLTLT